MSIVQRLFVPNRLSLRRLQPVAAPVIGYHASHEQHRPSALIDLASLAEDAGFEAVSCSDHLTPWSRAQGESGFAWSWLGAAMQATTVPYGVVNAPGQRYHPVIIAQAIATLLDLFPERLVVSLGSGEASNEHVTGDRWPAKAARNARLLECVGVVRALLRGEEVSLEGHVRVDRARLWTTPPSMPPLYAAALSVETAAWSAKWADGLLTVAGPHDHLRAMIEAFREGGGNDRPIAVQLKVAYGATDEAALAAAHEQWRTNVFDSTLMADLELVEQFEEAAKHVPPEAVADHVLVSSDPARHAAAIHGLLECGVDHVYVHDVTREQAPFIDVYGEAVLPELAAR